MAPLEQGTVRNGVREFTGLIQPDSGGGNRFFFYGDMLNNQVGPISTRPLPKSSNNHFAPPRCLGPGIASSTLLIQEPSSPPTSGAP